MESIEPISSSLVATIPPVLASLVCLAICLVVCRRLRPGEAGMRLFLKTTVALGAIVAVYAGAMFLGLAPANQEERAFLLELEKSSFGSDPHVKAVLIVAKEAPYVSHRHFMLAADAFQSVSSNK